MTTGSFRTAIVVPSERPESAAQPRLVVIAGPEIGRNIELAEKPVFIGRAEDVTLRVDSDAVSRRHAVVQRVLNSWVVADLGSTNGTYVNDVRVTTKELHEGDRIRIGKVVLKFSECGIEAQYHEQIFNMASLDALTGAFNKRYFDGVFEQAVQRSAKAGEPFSLLIFDIDHFKRINDAHGHPAGDAVLRKLVSVVRQQTRPDDVLCRVGGEEFVVLLPRTDLATARTIAEILRGVAEGTEFTHEGRRIPVTVSFGVAEVLSREDGASLYKRADGRLYEAKRAGRNRVSS